MEPGKALQEAINAIFPGPAAVSFSPKLTIPISKSPTGTLSVDKAVTGPMQPVQLTVDLDGPSVDYWMLGYNVESVRIYHKGEDDAVFSELKSIPVSTSGVQTRFQYAWTPTEADVGKHKFVALVETTLPVPFLEVADDSTREVEVKCVSVGAQSLARGATPAASSCKPTWTGTASNYVTGAIATSSTVTWTPDPDFVPPPESQGQVLYHAKGSMNLAFTQWTDLGCTVSPTVFAIGDYATDVNRMVVDFGVSPPTYAGAGALAPQQFTVSCPEGDPITAGSSFTWFNGGGDVTGVTIQASSSMARAVTPTRSPTTEVGHGVGPRLGRSRSGVMGPARRRVASGSDRARPRPGSSRA